MMITDRMGFRTDACVEEHFGVRISDPYRFLEEASHPDAVAWTQRQNLFTRETLDALPSRERFRRRFDELLDIGTIGVPVERGSRYWYTARRGSQCQAVLMVRESGVDRVLIDPAALDASGLTALDWWYPSPRGRYVAFGLSRNGDERSTLHVWDLENERRLEESIPHTRATSLAWLPDETGFYYTRRPPDSDYDMRVHRHMLGTSWESDERVFGEGRAREDWISVDLSENGRWLLASAQRGWSANDLYLADLHASTLTFKTIVEHREAIYDAMFRGDEIVLRSNEGAPRYALSVLDARDPRFDARRMIVPEGEDVLDGFTVTRDRIIARYLHDAHARLVSIRDDGEMLEAPLPPLGTIVGLSARESSSDAYVLYTSFTQPPTAYKVDPVTGSLSVWNAIASPIDTAPYRVVQEWYSSADGARIPVYVLSREDTPRDGTAPAVLTGYGGFNLSYPPTYFSTVLPWLDLGGVYAVASLRGGGEFGRAWHEAGMLANKQRVFDDFIAAARFLGSSGYADPARIGITGGSNGGLLTTAVMVQRPELFAAVVAEVPLCDMLRFHHFLIARLWISEYGDPEDADDFRILRAYSPYHNVRDGTAYPAMFLRTAESDSRVDPMHARKMGARVQAATSSGKPVLVQIERQAGHGAGKPRGRIVEDLADRWSFLAWQLGV